MIRSKWPLVPSEKTTAGSAAVPAIDAIVVEWRIVFDRADQEARILRWSVRDLRRRTEVGGHKPRGAIDTSRTGLRGAQRRGASPSRRRLSADVLVGCVLGSVACSPVPCRDGAAELRRSGCAPRLSSAQHAHAVLALHG